MKRATTQTLYFHVSRDNAPTLHVDQNETFLVETQLNRGPWIDDRPDRDELAARLPGRNPSSGAVFVNGAEVGSMLRVDIGQIVLDPLGFTSYSGSNGAIPGWFGPSALGSFSRILRIEDRQIVWSDRLRIPAKPMIGFVGVAPARESFHHGWAGSWGGNFDIQEITTGATVMLPVEAPGALVHIGDMHAIQGDGEICGAGGIEASGTVEVTCRAVDRPASMCGPRIEDATHIMTVGLARPAEDAFRHALEALILWMEDDYGFTRQDAYMLLAQVLEARCTQFVNPTFTYVAKIRKSYLG